jgi:hypothetical protein
MNSECIICYSEFELHGPQCNVCKHSVCSQCFEKLLSQLYSSTFMKYVRIIADILILKTRQFKKNELKNE